VRFQVVLPLSKDEFAKAMEENDYHFDLMPRDSSETVIAMEEGQGGN
jgi:hypothetical protein